MVGKRGVATLIDVAEAKELENALTTFSIRISEAQGGIVHTTMISGWLRHGPLPSMDMRARQASRRGMDMSDMDTTTQSVEDQVRAQVLAWRDAFVSKDVDAIMSFYTSEGFTGFDLMPPFEFSGGEMWRRNWEEFYAAFDGPLRLDIADLLVYAQNELAIARCAVRLAGTMHGRWMDSWVRTTNCFQLIDGQWLMFHDHVSWPVDFTTGKALMDLTPVRAAA